MSYYLKNEKNPKPITYEIACRRMTHQKAVAIMDYWNQYSFRGRIKTNEVIAAEEYLKNPIAFAQKHHKSEGGVYKALRNTKYSLKNKPKT